MSVGAVGVDMVGTGVATQAIGVLGPVLVGIVVAESCAPGILLGIESSQYSGSGSRDGRTFPRSHDRRRPVVPLPFFRRWPTVRFGSAMTRSGPLGIQSAPVSGMSRCLLLAVEAPPLEEKESN